jgi:hypothetical protein
VSIYFAEPTAVEVTVTQVTVLAEPQTISVTAGQQGPPGPGRTYAATIGDGTTLTFTVVHSLGTQDVIVGMYEAASPYQDVSGNGYIVEHTDTVSVTLTFTNPPAADEFRVVVMR